MTFPSILNPVTSLLRLQLSLGIASVEIHQTVHAQSAYAGSRPGSLYLTDKKSTNHHDIYGLALATSAQPAAELIRIDDTHSAFNVARCRCHRRGHRYRCGSHASRIQGSVASGIRLYPQPEWRFGES